jgi:hypothetical protein
MWKAGANEAVGGVYDNGEGAASLEEGSESVRRAAASWGCFDRQWRPCPATQRVLNTQPEEGVCEISLY